MSYFSNLQIQVEEILFEGKSEWTIASVLGIPVEWVETLSACPEATVEDLAEDFG